MKTSNEVWDDWAYDIGQKGDDKKSQQNDQDDVWTFFHFFWFCVAKFRLFMGIKELINSAENFQIY